MVAPLPAAAPPGTSSAPLPSNSPVIFVSGLLVSPELPAVSSSFSVSSPLHSALSSVLSSVPLPPARYFPPAPLYFLHAGRSFVVRPLPPAAVAVAVADVAFMVSRSAPSMPRVVPCPSLNLPPPPLSLDLLRPPAPPLAPPPLAPAANISRKDKDVGNWTGRCETHWLTAGGSAPRGKCPIIPLTVVRNSIIHPLFLQRPHQ